MVDKLSICSTKLNKNALQLLEICRYKTFYLFDVAVFVDGAARQDLPVAGRRQRRRRVDLPRTFLKLTSEKLDHRRIGLHVLKIVVSK